MNSENKIEVAGRGGLNRALELVRRCLYIVSFLVVLEMNCYGEKKEEGLVLYWSFDEGEGNILHDISGNKNHAGIYGPQWVDGIKGKALKFDGVDDYVECMYSEVLNCRTAVTVEAWVKLDSLNRAVMIVDRSYDSPRNSYYLHIHDNEVIFGVWNKDTQYFVATGRGTIAKGKWYHIVGTADGKYVKIYIDGELRGSKDYGSFTIGENVLNLVMGEYQGNIWYFDGIIDEVRIYNLALSDEEVKRNYMSVKEAQRTGRVDLPTKEMKKEAKEKLKEPPVDLQIDEIKEKLKKLEKIIEGAKKKKIDVSGPELSKNVVKVFLPMLERITRDVRTEDDEILLTIPAGALKVLDETSKEVEVLLKKPEKTVVYPPYPPSEVKDIRS